MDTPAAEHAEVRVTHRVTPETPPGAPVGDTACVVRIHVGVDGVPVGAGLGWVCR